MSKGWLRAIASNPLLADAITIVGLVDLNRKTAETLAAEFGLEDAVIGSDLAVANDPITGELKASQLIC